MAKRNHIHKYHHAQVNFGPTGKVWTCALPDCSHYMPHHMEQLVEGRASLCWECNTRFILNKENMKDDRPVCEKCKLGLNDTDVPLSDMMKEFISGGKV